MYIQCINVRIELLQGVRGKESALKVATIRHLDIDTNNRGHAQIRLSRHEVSACPCPPLRFLCPQKCMLMLLRCTLAFVLNPALIFRPLPDHTLLIT